MLGDTLDGNPDPFALEKTEPDKSELEQFLLAGAHHLWGSRTRGGRGSLADTETEDSECWIDGKCPPASKT